MKARVWISPRRWVTTACEVQAGQCFPNQKYVKIVFKNRAGDVVSIAEMERAALFELCNDVVDFFEDGASND